MLVRVSNDLQGISTLIFKGFTRFLPCFVHHTPLGNQYGGVKIRPKTDWKIEPQGCMVVKNPYQVTFRPFLQSTPYGEKPLLGTQAPNPKFSPRLRIAPNTLKTPPDKFGTHSWPPGGLADDIFQFYEIPQKSP